MKKYLSLLGYLMLYLAILGACVFGVANLWFKLLPADIAGKNTNFISLLSFLSALIGYAVIFKFRKKSLIKTCNFGSLSAGNWVMITFTGILMGFFTSCVCNLSYVVTDSDLKVMRQFVDNVEGGNTSLVLFLSTITIVFIFEEMIFRGVMFNEFRDRMPLYTAATLSTAAYGIFNYFFSGPVVAIYASIAAFFYALAYAYTGTLIASIILQTASMVTISVLRKIGGWNLMVDAGNRVLTILIAVSVFLILVAYYFMLRDFQRKGARQSASLPA